MSGPPKPRTPAICCLLHSLVPGGSTWQWIRLLSRHVEQGGRATIFAQPGPLGERARAAGIKTISVSWSEPGTQGHIWAPLGEHDAAIVQWEQGPVEAFSRAVEACGRAALVMHDAPQSITRWLSPPAPMRAQRAVQWAAAEPHAVVLVRGAAHRRKVAAAYGLSGGSLRILPPSVPLPSLPFRPAAGDPGEILAMTRLAPGKRAIVRVAVELARKRIAGGRACRLTIAGDGPWKPQAVALCEQRLPPGSWRTESAPDDPLRRLADSELVVAQGTTTLEAAALGRRVVVARSLGARGAAATVLTPERYEHAAQDPFGDPRVAEDATALWEELLAIDEAALRSLRQQVETHNSLGVSSHALHDALAAIC